MKLCRHCGTEKPLEEFYPSGSVKVGGHRRQSWCKKCMRDYANEAAFKKNYGIDWAERDRLIAAQNGRCGICGEEPAAKRLHLDHDHATGRVRGMLCGRCNRGLGQFKDSLDLLDRAKAWLGGGF